MCLGLPQWRSLYSLPWVNTLSPRWFSRALLVCTYHVVPLVHSAWYPVPRIRPLEIKRPWWFLSDIIPVRLPSLWIHPSHTVDLSHTHCSLWPFGLSFSYQHCGQTKIKRAQPQDRRWVLSTLLNHHGCITRTLLSSKEVVLACAAVFYTLAKAMWNISHHANLTYCKCPCIKMSSSSYRFHASPELVSRTSLVQLLLLTPAHESWACGLVPVLYVFMSVPIKETDREG